MRTMRGAAAALALALAACGAETAATVADGSSEAALRASVARMGETLDEGQRAQLKAAMAQGISAEEANGKSAAELVALGRAKRIAALKERVVPELRAALDAARVEIAEARKRADGAARLKAAFKIVDPSLRWTGPDRAVLAFQIENGTAEPIGKVKFRARARLPESAAPILDETFERTLSAEFVAGELGSIIVNPDLSLAANARAVEARAREDAAVEIELLQLATGGGRVVLDAEGVAQAEAAAAAAERALKDAEEELKSLEAGGPLRTTGSGS